LFLFILFYFEGDNLSKILKDYVVVAFTSIISLLLDERFADKPVFQTPYTQSV
jgi:hypothetical protein